MAEEIKTLDDLKEVVGEAETAPAEVAETVTETVVTREPQRDELGRSYATGKRKDAVARVWIKPGSGKVVVNGKQLATKFGQNTGWSWQKGETVSLAKGTSTIELADLTGFAGRCDAILLTSDADYKPDNSSEPMNAWRRKLLGIKTVDTEPYDLVVVGGGFTGLGTAIAAARMGLKVALIQNRPVLGGNGSSEIRVAPRGRMPTWLYPLGDIIKEFSPHIKSNVQEADKFHDGLKLKVVKAEPNIDLFLNHHAFGVDTKNNVIQSVEALAVKEKVVRRFKGRLFADCTGHGLIGKRAGADYEMKKDQRMGMSNTWRWRFVDKKADFPHQPWMLPLTENGFPYPNRRGDWYWESGFDKHPINDLETIRDHNFRAVYSSFSAMKNKGAYASKDKSGNSHANAELEWVAYIGGTRETLQILGDVILNKKDIVTGREFPDACAISTWGLDLHYAHPLYKVETPDNPFISRAHFGGRVDDSKGKLATSRTHSVRSKDGHGFDRKKGYAIPYRCLYSRNITNLFAPGRNMSVTHEALGTVRVMQTLGMCGAAVGRAAFVCKLHNTTPRGVYENHLNELKDAWSLPAKHREPQK